MPSREVHSGHHDVSLRNDRLGWAELNPAWIRSKSMVILRAAEMGSVFIDLPESTEFLLQV
ncbi:hypothetical protein C5E45_34815 [Nocardia nova]|uniref:Uncharacterized protein n=1 Tax=Nocardia nova TaxID=37330 RepID=A0A2S6A580_9NOCA|nr:hypothetical protein C5E45_34815 [Nocardia nova]